MNNQDEVREIRELAKKHVEFITSLTGFGQALHPKDIMPEFVEFADTLLAKKREACESVPRYYGNPKAKEMVYLEDVIKILS